MFIIGMYRFIGFIFYGNWKSCKFKTYYTRTSLNMTFMVYTLSFQYIVEFHLFVKNL